MKPIQSSTIFELSIEQALPALSRAAGTADLVDVVLSQTTELPEERRGYCARGLIASFTGSAKGRPWEKTLFVKRLHWNHYHEARHYELLESYGVPVAQCYGCVEGTSRLEILFLEYLSQVGIDVADAEQVSKLLRLHARLNALGVPQSYDKDIEVPDAKQLISEWTAAIDEFRSHGAAGSLGAVLATTCRTHSRDDMLAHVGATAVAVVGMPQALNHGEAGPANCGWRGAQLVLFDMHKVGPAPRFRDVSGLLDAVSDPEIGAVSWERATSIYLDEYRRLGGFPITDGQFIEDVAVLKRHNAYGILSWLTNSSLEDAEEGPRGRSVQRAWLQSAIISLLGEGNQGEW
jgi:hypothetical protein